LPTDLEDGADFRINIKMKVEDDLMSQVIRTFIALINF